MASSKKSAWSADGDGREMKSMVSPTVSEGKKRIVQMFEEHNEVKERGQSLGILHIQHVITHTYSPGICVCTFISYHCKCNVYILALCCCCFVCLMYTHGKSNSSCV